MTDIDYSTHEMPSWEEMFAEGEKRIKSQFVDAMILTPTRDRARLLTEREVIQRRIDEALFTRNAKRLRVALRAQVRLLARLHATRGIKNE